MPKLSVKHQSSKISNKLEFSTLPRNLAKLLLYAVPSIRQGWTFWLEWRKFILFLSVGKSGKGKSSFAILGFALGGADCKCAFSYALANCFLLIVAPTKCNFSDAKILSAVSNFIYAIVKSINYNANNISAIIKILKDIINIISGIKNFKNEVLKITTANWKILKDGCKILFALANFKF